MILSLTSHATSRGALGAFRAVMHHYDIELPIASTFLLPPPPLTSTQAKYIPLSCSTIQFDAKASNRRAVRDSREAKLTRLLRLIGLIVNNWLIKVCNEITKDSAKLRKNVKSTHANPKQSQFTHGIIRTHLCTRQCQLNKHTLGAHASNN